MRLFRIATIAIAATNLGVAAPAKAHCDGLDGPVVSAARAALEKGDPNPILIWVQPGDEPEVRAAFAEALEVRKLNPNARKLADRFLFETLVRLHRAGEGAPYTGLKPAGRDLGPAISLADKAIASNSDQKLAAFLSTEAAKGVNARFRDLQSKRHFRPDDLAGGRAYVESYVGFIHHVENLHAATASVSEAHSAQHSAAVHDP